MRKIYWLLCSFVLLWSVATLAAPMASAAYQEPYTFKVKLALSGYNLKCSKVWLQYYDYRNVSMTASPSFQDNCTVTFQNVAGDRASRNALPQLKMEGYYWRGNLETTATNNTGYAWLPTVRQPTWWERRFANSVPDLGTVYITSQDRRY